MGKRYRIDRTPGHYVQRDRRGRFKKWTSIPKGITRDEPREAKRKKPRSEYGYGHLVDYPKKEEE